MRNYLTSFIASLAMLLVATLSANADAGGRLGVSLIYGSADTSGQENEKSGDVGPETNKKDFQKSFTGGSVFVEHEWDNGFTLGLDWIPADIDLGDGKRTDVTTDASESTQDDKTVSASAQLENLITLYAHAPLGGTGAYVLAGWHQADITTAETLHNSTYPDADVNGYQIGLGYKAGRFGIEAFYSDFEDVKLTSTSGSSTVQGDADVYGIKIKVSFGTQDIQRLQK